jgi:hypothetical protein
MGAHDARFSRIDKLFTDRDQVAPEAALLRRQKHSVMLVCGADVAQSRTLQLAVLTSARIAKRCFPGAVYAAIPPSLEIAQQLVWPGSSATFGQSLAAILGPHALVASHGVAGGSVVAFGDAEVADNGLRATFDGWIACVGPAGSTPRMAEKEYCSLAGVLCAALAMSEVFMAFARITLQAGRRNVALSLWRPDLPVSDPDALGYPVEFLPREAWLLGLGHLGNAYLWALATLSYPAPRHVRLFLNDFDRVEGTNLETGVVFESGDEGALKTRVLDRWLRSLGFDTRFLERRLDTHFRRQEDEPRLAFCGFDSNQSRRHIETAGFGQAIESGLGGKAGNFDTISMHSYPNTRSAMELWPDLEASDAEKEIERQQKLAQENAGYKGVAHDECGRVAFAGKSIAVPFVGVTAATLVVAESLRLLHGGPAYGQLKLRLATPEICRGVYLGDYSAEQAAGIPFVTLT